MGEAKRRKQLGLMPQETAVNFTYSRGGELLLQGGVSEDVAEALRFHVLHRLGDTAGAWDREHRRAHLLDAEREYETRADLETIATPQRARGLVSLVTGKIDSSPADDAMPIMGQPGNWTRLRKLEVSFDGEQWQPRRAHTDGLQLLMTGHRALQEDEGDPTEVFYELPRSGEVSLSQDAPLSAESREQLKKELRNWFGALPEQWDEEYRDYHAHFVPEELSEAQIAQLPTPLARRGSVLLTPDHVILPPFSISAFLLRGWQAQLNLDEETVTFDGQTWEALPGSDEGDEDSDEDAHPDDFNTIDVPARRT